MCTEFVSKDKLEFVRLCSSSPIARLYSSEEMPACLVHWDNEHKHVCALIIGDPDRKTCANCGNKTNLRGAEATRERLGFCVPCYKQFCKVYDGMDNIPRMLASSGVPARFRPHNTDAS
jgi:hypothetical protein